jgi:N-acetylglucosaminyldiphosphoundecaprenol N-acetyl-beta-D-mannosaminyltransferase
MMTEPLSKPLRILGVPVNVFNSYDEAAELARERIVSRRQTLCVAINPAKIYHAKRNPKLKNILESAHLRICDGVGVALAAKLLRHQTLPRCTGIGLFLRLIAMSAREGWKVFLLGASTQANHAARRSLLADHPGLRIVGNRNGYFKDSQEVVGAINRSGADLLFVAMGSPRQEFWMSEYLPHLDVRFAMGVGGSLDVVGGYAKWAPEFFRKTGTEWLFRSVLQPRRRLPVLWTNGLFALDALKAVFTGAEEEETRDTMRPAA